jgi:hypothetical protein
MNANSPQAQKTTASELSATLPSLDELQERRATAGDTIQYAIDTLTGAKMVVTTGRIACIVQKAVPERGFQKGETHGLIPKEAAFSLDKRIVALHPSAVATNEDKKTLPRVTPAEESADA